MISTMCKLFDNATNYLTYRAYHHFLNGEPVPFDLYLSMEAIGLMPERLIECFENGCIPPFNGCDCSSCEMNNPCVDSYEDDDDDKGGGAPLTLDVSLWEIEFSARTGSILAIHMD